MKKRIILLGDSITQGLGSKKINFTRVLQNLLGQDYFVDNMAFTGTTIRYAEEILSEVIAKEPSCVVVLYGNVDAQIRPNRNGKVFKHIPKRFQGSGMLMPRPFYSHDLKKRTGQKIENLMRHVFSEIIYLVDGTEQWVPIEEFSQRYRNVVNALKGKKISVITCSTVYIDEKLFPGSLSQYERFNNEILKIANQCNTAYVDLFLPLKKKVEEDGWNKRYCYDHFHPNGGGGYAVIADILAKEILQNDSCLSKE